MFGLGTARRRQERLLAILELRAEFHPFKADAPAGAWLFARTIFNASNSILASRETPAKLVAELEAERELSLGSTSKADGGGRQENEIPIDITIRDIGSHGSHYRDLQPSDSEPPADETLQGVLRSGGHTSLSELIAAIRRDYESAGRKP